MALYTGEELERIVNEAATWKAFHQPNDYPDPVIFADQILKSPVWSKQGEIMRSVVRYTTTWVKACHGSGKSFLSALLLLWWLARWEDGVVISTAPKQDQVERILWGEVHAAVRRSIYPFPQPNVASLKFNEKRYASGHTTSVTANKGATGFQGTHSGHVLIIVDEAPGIHPEVWGAIQGIMAAGFVRVLALGNPTIPSGPFFDAFAAQSVTANCITISAFDTPNFVGVKLEYKDPQSGKKIILGDPDGRELMAMSLDELNDNPAPYLTTKSWVYNRFKEVGPNHHEFVSRALGQFPHEAPDSLVSLRWLEDAANRELFDDSKEPIKGGVDVAGPGEDETTLCLRQGRNIILQKAYPDADARGRVLQDLMPYKDRIDNLNIDSDGIGYYFARTLEENGFRVTDCHAGWAAIDGERYANWKAEMYWGFRMRIKDGDITGLKDSVCAGQLATIRWKPNARGQTVIESKEEARKRGVKSPDRAEGCMLAFAEAPAHGVLELWKQETEAARNRPPEPLGPKVEDNTPIPPIEQHKAAKEEIGGVLFDPDMWREKPKTRPKPICSACGCVEVREYAETWACPCGATGRIA